MVMAAIVTTGACHASKFVRCHYILLKSNRTNMSTIGVLIPSCTKYSFAQLSSKQDLLPVNAITESAKLVAREVNARLKCTVILNAIKVNCFHISKDVM